MSFNLNTKINNLQRQVNNIVGAGVASLNTQTGALNITSANSNLVVGSTGAGNIQLTVSASAIPPSAVLVKQWGSPEYVGTFFTTTATSPTWTTASNLVIGNRYTLNFNITVVYNNVNVGSPPNDGNNVLELLGDIYYINDTGIASNAGSIGAFTPWRFKYNPTGNTIICSYVHSITFLATGTSVSGNFFVPQTATNTGYNVQGIIWLMPY